jgi:hypothetical protein
VGLLATKQLRLEAGCREKPEAWDTQYKMDEASVMGERLWKLG